MMFMSLKKAFFVKGAFLTIAQYLTIIITDKKVFQQAAGLSH